MLGFAPLSTVPIGALAVEEIVEPEVVTPFSEYTQGGGSRRRRRRDEPAPIPAQETYDDELVVLLMVA